jgi:hypothetical protein
MDHRRIHQKKSSGALVVVAIALVALTGVLFAHTYVRQLIEDIAPDSADVVLAALKIAWCCLAAWLAATLIRHISPRFLFPFDDKPRRRKILSDLVSGLISCSQNTAPRLLPLQSRI